MKIQNNRCLYYSNSFVVNYRAGKLIKVVDGKNVSELILYSKKKYILSKSRMIERMLRLEPKFVRLFDDESIMVSFDGKLALIDIKEWIIKDAFHYRDGMRNPLNIACIEGAYEKERKYVLGDYFSNDSRETVSIMSLTSFGFNCLYEFPSCTIRHIHRCIYDDKDKRLIVLTGDEDNESGFWEYSKIDCKMIPILVGSQQYRSCVAFYKRRSFLFATDTPLEHNYIYYFNENTNSIDKICSLPGPCIYGSSIIYKDERYYIFATSVEPDSRISKFKYLFATKRSEYIEDNNVHIYFGNMEIGFKDILTYNKDFLPMGLFQLGSCAFGFDNNEHQLIVLPTGLKKFDGKTLFYSGEELMRMFKTKQ